jgi:hypothetical protein
MATTLDEVRSYAKYNVKLTPFGKAIIDAAVENDVPQAVVARLLDISPSAVNRYYK